jgi:hypothetical protein
MIFLIVSLLRDYKYQINEDNCVQFIRDLIERIDAEQMEQVNRIKEMIENDRENHHDGFGR